MAERTSSRKLYNFAGPNGGGWEFDEATLTRIMQRWFQIADICINAMDDSKPMREIQAPGLEMASEYYAEKANKSGFAYLDTVVQMRDYALGQAEACKKALGIYSESDLAAVAVFTGLAGWENQP